MRGDLNQHRGSSKNTGASNLTIAPKENGSERRATLQTVASAKKGTSRKLISSE